jgi:hypothetical protein
VAYILLVLLLLPQLETSTGSSRITCISNSLQPILRTTRLGFGFPQLPYSSLAFPFSGVSTVGEACLLTSFHPTQLLPLWPSHGVISSFPCTGRNLPLKPQECPLRVRTNPRCFGAQAWHFCFFTCPFLCFEGFPWCDTYLSYVWGTWRGPKRKT